MIRWMFLPLLGTLLSACDHISYYGQAVRGQAELLLAREPISKLLQSSDLDAQLREQLLLVEAARKFAEQELQLPAHGSFTSYVDPGREHLVWNVFATRWNSVDLQSWCFPVAGCVGYRGYFSEQAARQYAGRLIDQGYDVYVGGVDAYSTLGWFRDPLPATVLRRSQDQLAGLIFHELAHQKVYLPGDTVFNESFASFVERKGLQHWHSRPGARLRAPDESDRQFVATQALQQRFAVHVAAYREQLRILYQSAELPPDAMRARKQEIIDAMRAEWLGGPDAPAYSGWFEGDINNARMATVAAYFDHVPAFEQLFIESGADFQRFYESVEALAELPAQERAMALQRLAASALGDS